MKAKPFFSLAAAVAVSVLVSSTALAQATTVARSYTVTPKPGMAAQFEAALRAHAQWREENGDPWTWSVTMHETGENIGAYGIRSGGHSWADFDAYDAGFGSKSLPHWQATVEPLVESTTSTISSMNPALSNPPQTGSWNFVTVTTFQIRPGQEGEFNRLTAQAAAVIMDDAGWDWVWVSPVSGGGPGPFMRLAVFAENWTDMEAPDPSFDDIMIQEMGADAFQEWATAWARTFRGTESYTLRLRPDLGVN